MKLKVIGKRKSTVAVLGGGIAGCMAALKLAQEFPNINILIIEQKEELLLGSSNRSPGRMGLGFHYSHLNTAVTYLRETLKFVQQYRQLCPNFVVGQEYPEEHPIRNGRYFIMKDSSVPAQEILAVYAALAQEYAEFVENGNKEVFGDPKSFFRILEEDEYRDDVNMEKIAVGIETREHLLNWPSFREYLLHEIQMHSNIKVHTCNKVEDIRYSYNSSSFSIQFNHTRDDNNNISKIAPCWIEVPFVINATWEWVDYFNSKIGHFPPPGKIRTNRVKAILTVKLPDELIDKNSMFFCMGPHCMFSNMGNCLGMITYAPETNQCNSTSIIPPEKYMKFINGEVMEEEKLKLAQDILNGAVQYIPAMNQAQIVKLDFGTVQTLGNTDIFDPTSEVYKRDYLGIECLEQGFISLPCMKLLYAQANAKIVVRLFSQFSQNILPLANDIKKEAFSYLQLERESNRGSHERIAILTGLCFAWFKKACSSSEQGTVEHIPFVKHFCSDFFKKLNLNTEFKKLNQFCQEMN